jgi:hypothetical protein
VIGAFQRSGMIAAVMSRLPNLTLLSASSDGHGG